LNYTETVLGVNEQTKLIETFGRRNLRFSWGMAEFGSLYRMGYRWCDNCIIMISIKEVHCPVCKKQMRTGPKVKRK